MALEEATVSSRIEPTDERIKVADDVDLRVLRWVPARGSKDESSPASPFLLVHGLASNARLWEAWVGGSRMRVVLPRQSICEARHSDRPEGGYDFGTVAGDCGRWSGPRAGLRAPVLVGQSWGRQRRARTSRCRL